VADCVFVPAWGLVPTYSPNAMFRLPVIAALIAIVAIAPPAAAQNLGGDLLDQSGRVVQLGPGADPLPSVWAKTWIIADAGTGEVLAARRAHKKRAPASTIKTLTALTVLPQLPLDSTTQAKRQAVRMYGSRVGLKRGKTYTIEQLMNAMILPSANDAAVALAQANGSVPRTVREMNAMAEKLQAVNTTARNPSGLDAPGMVSTAYDLALIGRAALADPALAEFLKRKNAEFPGKGKKMRTIYTNNRLLLSNYRGAVGVKTGYTSRAGRTYIGAAERGGRTLIVVLMGINERSDVAAKKLLDWGFANASRVTPVGQLVDPLEAVPVTGEVLVEGGGEDAPVVVQAIAEPSVSDEVIAMPDESGAATDTGLIWLAAVVVLLVGGLLVVRARRRSH
jgi:D-alanyl-D-alanine carboxypeptidase (penicillin-binding protein 5/6)